MRRHLHFILPYVLLAMAVICLVLAMPGCGLQQLPPQERARVLVVDTVEAIEDIRAQYQDLYDIADPETRLWLWSEIAPAIDEATAIAQAASEPIRIWVKTGVEPGNSGALIESLRAALKQATRALALAAMRVEDT